MATSNAGAKSDSPEQFLADAVTKTAPAALPVQRTSRRRAKKPVEIVSVPAKKRGRPSKAASSAEPVLDLVPFNMVACSKDKEHSGSKGKDVDDHKEVEGGS
ncbi:hypothetical protein TSUD_04330 [Trifolium subterraneum]|nr:hypothetical protein TSUD_04330 [Trifolium subterraneum]